MSTLAYDLHRLVRTLDQSAEARLAHFGIFYARYLALLARAGERLGSEFDDVVRGIGQDPAVIADHVPRLTAITEESP